MHTLGLANCQGEKDCPAHLSPPALRWLDSLDRLNTDIAEGIRRSPEPFREVMAAMHAEILQLRRMVSEGVILAMVRDEFWGPRCYEQVGTQVEQFAKIMAALKHTARVNYDILAEICREQGKPVPPSLDDRLEEAFRLAQQAAEAA